MTALDSRPEAGTLTPTDAADLVRGVRATFNSGRTRSLDWRKRQLQGLARLLTEREHELLEAVAQDLGKSDTEGWLTELAAVRSEIDHTLHHLDRWVRPERVGVRAILRPARASIVAEPLGAVLIIAPWNYPIQLLLGPMAAALSAGNVVVGKPSEISPATSAALARWIPDYLDPDAVAIVEGDAAVVTALLGQRWDHILYTGNGRVGRIVMEAAAKHLTPVTLELGGKSPVFVDKSANLEVAAKRVAWGKFLNAGQTCIAPDYVLVDRSVEDAFVASLVKAVRAFYGPDPAASHDYGRIVNANHWDRLQGLLDGHQSGRVVLGGQGNRSARYLAPTVIQGATWDEPLMSDEIFGPILPVITVDGVGEAIDTINAHDKPLALYVFAEDQAVVDRMVAQTSSGGVGANVTLLHVAVPNLPFGGVGPSGMGAYHGKAGFDTFSHRKPVLQRPTKLDPPVTYPPYTNLKRRLLRRVF
jgi:aldehyde dehydrogenase (NAD+)